MQKDEKNRAVTFMGFEVQTAILIDALVLRSKQAFSEEKRI